MILFTDHSHCVVIFYFFYSDQVVFAHIYGDVGKFIMINAIHSRLK